MIVLAIMFLWGLASISFAFDITAAVHGTDGQKINWSVFGWAPTLIFIGMCWAGLGLGLAVRFA